MKSRTETYIQQTRKLLAFQQETTLKLLSMLSSTAQEMPRSEALSAVLAETEQNLKKSFSLTHHLFELYGNESYGQPSGATSKD